MSDENAQSVSDTERSRPMRDVSAKSAIGNCDHCGGNAHSLLGGEHIWKCSKIVPKAALEPLVEDWRETAEEIDSPEESINALNACANQLEEVLQQ